MSPVILYLPIVNPFVQRSYSLSQNSLYFFVPCGNSVYLPVNSYNVPAYWNGVGSKSRPFCIVIGL